MIVMGSSPYSFIQMILIFMDQIPKINAEGRTK